MGFEGVHHPGNVLPIHVEEEWVFLDITGLVITEGDPHLQGEEIFNILGCTYDTYQGYGQLKEVGLPLQSQELYRRPHVSNRNRIRSVQRNIDRDLLLRL